MNTHEQTSEANLRLGSNSSNRKTASGTLQSSGLSASTAIIAMADPASQDVSASLALLTSNAATESEVMLPSSSAPASAMERAKIKNRTAQKRFRDRQKASRVCAHALRGCKPT